MGASSGLRAVCTLSFTAADGSLLAVMKDVELHVLPESEAAFRPSAG